MLAVRALLPGVTGYLDTCVITCVLWEPTPLPAAQGLCGLPRRWCDHGNEASAAPSLPGGDRVSGGEASHMGLYPELHWERPVDTATSHERLLDPGHRVWTPVFHGKV